MNVLIPHAFEANYTVGFARGLTAAGVECCVVSDDDIAARLDAAKIPHLNLRGSTGRQRGVLIKFLNLLRYYAALLRFCTRCRGETFHFTGIWRSEFILFEGGLLHPALKLLSGRYLYTAHNLLPHSRRHSRLFRWYYRWIYVWPDIIIAHSEQTAAGLRTQFGVSNARIRVVSIGLNEEIPSTDLSPAVARRQLGLSPEHQAILCFGKIEPYKGVDRLIEAFAGVPNPNTRLIIAGAFRDEAYRRTIRDLIALSPRRADIRLLDQTIPNDEVEVLFKGCDLLCLPYRSIDQSGLMYLAPRFGLPIVGTPVGALADFVTLGFGAVSATNDEHGIREALTSFLKAPRARREVIIERAQAFRWESVCRHVADLYRPRKPMPARAADALGSERY